MILFSLYAFISLQIDQFLDIMMNMGYKFISGNLGKLRPLNSVIPGNDRKFQAFPVMTGSYNWL